MKPVTTHSKHVAKTILSRLSLFSLALGSVVPLAAQNYSIHWLSVDGAGPRCASLNYALTGSLGQPDNGLCLSKNYSLSAGFWCQPVAVQTAGAPVLHISRDSLSGVIRIWWLKSAEGFVLEQASDVGGMPGDWTQVLPPYEEKDSDYVVEIPPPGAPRMFYRLFKP